MCNSAYNVFVGHLRAICTVTERTHHLGARKGFGIGFHDLRYHAIRVLHGNYELVRRPLFHLPHALQRSALLSLEQMDFDIHSERTTKSDIICPKSVW